MVIATRLAGAKEVFLIGDVNQFTFIDRLNLFEMQYIRLNPVATVTKDLLCTYRNPVDIAYVLNEVNSGIYSSVTQVRSLRMERYSDANIPKDFPNTIYLTNTQVEKESLITQGFGKGHVPGHPRRTEPDVRKNCHRSDRGET
ncbi:Replication protein 1a [Eumeta japonica]|uniref:Replication protein 1a n=1 Tax=Eumeta variegata TaxID=151549 RepID=A0A4C1YYP7_EUMVA|nr:Replication protein 1a [Eumeta japonica]